MQDVVACYNRVDDRTKNFGHLDHTTCVSEMTKMSKNDYALLIKVQKMTYMNFLLTTNHFLSWD